MIPATTASTASTAQEAPAGMGRLCPCQGMMRTRRAQACTSPLSTNPTARVLTSSHTVQPESSNCHRGILYSAHPVVKAVTSTSIMPGANRSLPQAQ